MTGGKKFGLFILVALFCLLFLFVVTTRAGRGGGGQTASSPSSTGRGHRHQQNGAGRHSNQDDNDGDDDDETIEDVDEDKIDSIVDENDKNLVIVFYDKETKCPHCKEALRELEEIDDDLESAGYIEVVKTDDRKVAKELGVLTFPALIYYRRKNPILYDGDYEDSESILKWIRAHDEVATVNLYDSDFEDVTDSYSPSEGALDWFVMFYDSKKLDCNAYVAVWETVAHKLRGIVHIGKVDISESDDVADRFNVDDEDDCPTFFLLRKGKMYRYRETARDVKSFTRFALQSFKDQRGHRVPEPPTMIEELYEDLKEEFEDVVGDYGHVLLAAGGCIALVSLIGAIVWAIKTFKSRRNPKKDS